MTSIHRFEEPVIDLLKGIISLVAKDTHMLKRSVWIKPGITFYGILCFLFLILSTTLDDIVQVDIPKMIKELIDESQSVDLVISGIVSFCLSLMDMPIVSGNTGKH